LPRQRPDSSQALREIGANKRKKAAIVGRIERFVQGFSLQAG